MSQRTLIRFVPEYFFYMLTSLATAICVFINHFSFVIDLIIMFSNYKHQSPKYCLYRANFLEVIKSHLTQGSICHFMPNHTQSLQKKTSTVSKLQFAMQVTEPETIITSLVFNISWYRNVSLKKKPNTVLSIASQSLQSHVGTKNPPKPNTDKKSCAVLWSLVLQPLLLWLHQHISTTGIIFTC